MPRAWADQYGLKKGAFVSLEEASDGTLVVDSKYYAKPQLKLVSLRAGQFLSREISGGCLLGFGIIRIEAKERSDIEVRAVVKSTVRSLIGLEIIGETYS